MTNEERSGRGGDTGSNRPIRRAQIETSHADADVAHCIARSLRPDNTAEMATDVDGKRIVTTIERDTTGGLQTTVDDYVVNLQVASEVCDENGRDTNECDSNGRDENGRIEAETENSTADTTEDTVNT